MKFLKMFLVECMGKRKFLTNNEIWKLRGQGFEVKVLEELSELESNATQELGVSRK